ncbi:MAG: hypothetical protein F4222_11380 [Gammaproteobacteria bacterium]|nr:hypothetical protein [Gammaproteobacteria bacterium]MXW20452.1 hypothetical protein [Gammaproteobacteria bacterium]MYF59651.1 hypothetical protein [Gammaproteobacteria bacterium]
MPRIANRFLPCLIATVAIAAPSILAAPADEPDVAPDTEITPAPTGEEQSDDQAPIEEELSDDQEPIEEIVVEGERPRPRRPRVSPNRPFVGYVENRPGRRVIVGVALPRTMESLTSRIEDSAYNESPPLDIANELREACASTGFSGESGFRPRYRQNSLLSWAMRERVPWRYREEGSLHAYECLGERREAVAVEIDEMWVQSVVDRWELNADEADRLRALEHEDIVLIQQFSQIVEPTDGTPGEWVRTPLPDLQNKSLLDALLHEDGDEPATKQAFELVREVVTFVKEQS